MDASRSDLAKVEMMSSRAGPSDPATASPDASRQLNYATIFNASSNAMAISHSTTGVILDVNATWISSTGIDYVEAIGRAAIDLGIWADPKERAACLATLKDQGRVRDFQAHLNMGTKNRLHLISGQYIKLTDQLCVLWEFRDVHDIAEANQTVKQLNKELTATLLAIPDLLFCLSEDGQYLAVWANNEDLLAAQRDALLGRNVNDVLPKRAADEVMHAIAAAILKGSSGGHQIELDLPLGKRWFELSTSVRSVDSQGRHSLMMLSRDVTERKQAVEQVEYLAYHDQLTGLANRRLLLDRLKQAISVAKRTQRFGAVLFLDLDRFKHINDIYGHEVGDDVLKAVCARLTATLREGDTIARFGGDEFVAILPELSIQKAAATQMARHVAEKLRTLIEGVIHVRDLPHQISVSIGVALFPNADTSADALIQEADIAMYQAKESGRNAIVFFEQAMQKEIAERYALENDIRVAAANGELVLHLQSQVNSEQSVVAAEVLVRWNHPRLGLLYPNKFIGIAEETGHIVEIGDWVLHEACKLIANLDSSVRLAVNVSPHQFRQPSFAKRVADLLSVTGADPVCLVLEITEGLLLEQTEDVVAHIQDLTDLGIRFSIDDFGTGYSSLAYLKRLPLNELKIDKSFVDEIPDDPNDRALTETILSMAHHLSLEVVAEGVETVEQYEFLRDRGCELFQGYFFHKPEPVHAWLERLMPQPHC